tara:strand:+ start:6665 stop:7909 length:1245 start_codon:yes stop_codon:yes gene_type:complete
MGKISPVSAKYIVHAHITIEGVVDRPDVIGAIFGQTEGLLGGDLELRELQRNGRIGRIEVKLDTKVGKTSGDILIPSSLDKAETAIIAAALETIQRIGPCTALVKSKKIEDVRVSKRTQVIERAKELLRDLTDTVLPDSKEIADEVSQSVLMMGIVEYGKDRLPAGPAIDESEEIVLVEGRADVLALLKNGFKSVIALNGTSVPKTVIDLCKKKEATVFVDGDRGGQLIIKELMATTEVDFIAKAPDGKEVEELTKKEIHISLRAKMALEQVKLEMETPKSDASSRRYEKRGFRENRTFTDRRNMGSRQVAIQKPRLTTHYQSKFKEMLDELFGTKGAYILDEANNILGKVPTSELSSTIRSLGEGTNAVILDGVVNLDLLKTAERSKVKYLVARESSVKPGESSVAVITKGEL